MRQRHWQIQCILGYWRFMQIRQRIFNCTEMQITYFILDKRLKLLTYYTPFYHQSLRSCDLKNSPFFGHPVDIKTKFAYILLFAFWWAEPGGNGPWCGWLTVVLECCTDAVGLVIWPVKSSPKYKISYVSSATLNPILYTNRPPSARFTVIHVISYEFTIKPEVMLKLKRRSLLGRAIYRTTNYWNN